jgi:hypothetical protein
MSALRFSAIGLIAAGCACAAVAAALASSTACITAPPPDLPQPPPHRPTILHDSVWPPPDQILASLPTSDFVVPVELDDPNQSFEWEVFVDYDPLLSPSSAIFTAVPPSPDDVDGGIYTVDFPAPSVPQAPDPGRCHRIDFLVAHHFDSASPHTWDSIGGDNVTWIYNPGGSPGGCPVYDAGSLQDGAFPPPTPDAPPDTLPIVPESGGDP